MRPLPTLLVAAALLLLSAPEARAEDVFVLDNGVVVRGFVVREEGERLVVRLTGFAEANTVTLRTSEIVRRFASVEPHSARGQAPSERDLRPIHDDLAWAPQRPAAAVAAAEEAFADAPSGADLPLAAEGFFARLQRVTVLALPRSLEGRLLVGLLFFLVLAVIVAGGTRVIGMKAPTVQASSTLGLLLGAFLAANIGLHDELLRADRALWVLPLQAAIWLAAARAALDAPLARVVPLFAFVLFGSACCVFLTGSVLVSV